VWDDAFNYFLSLHRQCVERAFGILVQRWGIFWRALRVKFSRIPLLIRVCCRLHNFIIDKFDMEQVSIAQGDAREGDIASTMFIDGTGHTQGRRVDLEKSDHRKELVAKLRRDEAFEARCMQIASHIELLDHAVRNDAQLGSRLVKVLMDLGGRHRRPINRVGAGLGDRNIGDRSGGFEDRDGEDSGGWTLSDQLMKERGPYLSKTAKARGRPHPIQDGSLICQQCIAGQQGRKTYAVDGPGIQIGDNRGLQQDIQLQCRANLRALREGAKQCCSRGHAKARGMLFGRAKMSNWDAGPQGAFEGDPGQVRTAGAASGRARG